MEAVVEALHYFTSAILRTLPTLVENNQLYTLKDEELSKWLVVRKCQLGTDMLSLVFFEVLSREMRVMGGTRLQAQNTQVMEVDDNRILVL